MHCSATALETTVVVERLNHSSKTEELHVREEVREREKGEGQSEREKGEREMHGIYCAYQNFWSRLVFDR